MHGHLKNPEKEMTFWEHLEELRWHIIRSLIVIIVFTILALISRKIIFDHVILAPRDAGFISYRVLCRLAEAFHVHSLCIKDISLKIINLTMTGQFLTHIYVSIAVGLVLASPYVLWEFWRFIGPALKINERRYARSTVLVMSLLFFFGVLFGYFVLVPWTLNFFGNYQVSASIQNQISLRSYISTVVTMSLGVGVVFELPVAAFFLTKIGIMTPAFMKRNRKYAIVILLIIAAVITPPDVFSQIIVTLPLYGLYELGIYVSKRAYARQSNLKG